MITGRDDPPWVEVGSLWVDRYDFRTDEPGPYLILEVGVDSVKVLCLTTGESIFSSNPHLRGWENSCRRIA